MPAAQLPEHKKATHNLLLRFYSTSSFFRCHFELGKSTSTLYNVNLVAGVKDNWLNFHNQIWEISTSLPHCFYSVDVSPVRQTKFMALFLLFVRLMLSRLPNKNRYFFSSLSLSSFDGIFKSVAKTLLWITSADSQSYEVTTKKTLLCVYAIFFLFTCGDTFRWGELLLLKGNEVALSWC